MSTPALKKRTLICISLLAILSAGMALGSAEISCDGATFDFGSAGSTQSVHHTFIISNEGNEILRINRVIGCCGATTRLGTNAISPGESTTFNVKMSLRGRSGRQRKAFYLVCNSPGQQYYQLRFTGSVTSDSRLLDRTVAPQPTAAIQQRDPRLDASDIPLVIVDYFYEEGCPDCLRVRKEIMPVLQMQFEGLYQLNRYDINFRTNVPVLVAYQEKLRIAENEPVCMVVDYQHVLNGFEAIKKGLSKQMGESVVARLSTKWKAPEPITSEEVLRNRDNIVRQRAKKFSLPVVIVNGLLDGVNPCAIGTLVFFMSLLTVSGVRGRGLLVMGGSYCVGSYVTYTALGFGLLHVLHSFSGFRRVQTGIEMAMVIILVVLAFVSFRDALMYRETGDPDRIALQLPHKIKMVIHKVMKAGLGLRALAISGLVVGAIVTALESVCTGQVYVPTLIYVAGSHGADAKRAGGLLLTYNAMFIVPLIVVLALGFLGLTTESLVRLSKRNVVPAKVLLGILFVVMAVLIALL